MITLAKWSIEDYHRMISAGILRECHVELLEVEGKVRTNRKLKTQTT